MVRAFSRSGHLKMTSIVGDSFTQVLATRMPFVVDNSVWRSLEIFLVLKGGGLF